jgi:hypothetical protein
MPRTVIGISKSYQTIVGCSHRIICHNDAPNWHLTENNRECRTVIRGDIFYKVLPDLRGDVLYKVLPDLTAIGYPYYIIIWRLSPRPRKGSCY